jgi:predicted outer membrane repeat protein
MTLEHGHRLKIQNNTAGLNGGGVYLEGNSVLSVLDEGCTPAVCSALARGNGQCDPGCMSRACNWFSTQLQPPSVFY